MLLQIRGGLSSTFTCHCTTTRSRGARTDSLGNPTRHRSLAARLVILTAYAALHVNLLRRSPLHSSCGGHNRIVKPFYSIQTVHSQFEDLATLGLYLVPSFLL